MPPALFLKNFAHFYTVKKHKTNKERISFFKKFYIVQNAGGQLEVSRKGYDKLKDAEKDLKQNTRICTPEELVKMPEVWESFHDCYDIEMITF